MQNTECTLATLLSRAFRPDCLVFACTMTTGICIGSASALALVSTRSISSDSDIGVDIGIAVNVCSAEHSTGAYVLIAM